jgi:hypothetical protein
MVLQNRWMNFKSERTNSLRVLGMHFEASKPKDQTMGNYGQISWRVFLVLIFALGVCIGAFAQEATMSPLGVLVSPSKPITPSERNRKILPPKSVVRLMQHTALANNGEDVLVYDNGDEFEPDPHICVIQNDALAADFSLVSIFKSSDISPSWTLFQASSFADTKAKGFVAVFRNIGNGAGSLFIVLTHQEGKYTVAWKARTSQGHLRISKVRWELWDSEMDGGCTWCAHHYKISKLVWISGKLITKSSSISKRTFDPGSISNPAIEFAAKSASTP